MTLHHPYGPDELDRADSELDRVAHELERYATDSELPMPPDLPAESPGRHRRRARPRAGLVGRSSRGTSGLAAGRTHGGDGGRGRDRGRRRRGRRGNRRQRAPERRQLIAALARGHVERGANRECHAVTLANGEPVTDLLAEPDGQPVGQPEAGVTDGRPDAIRRR